MKAVIFSVPTPTSPGFCWAWRSIDSEAESKSQFAYYYDCLADAQASGFAVRPSFAQGNTAPGWGSLTAQAPSQAGGKPRR